MKKKIIKIQTEEDYEVFIKHLKFYKSKLFSATTFTIENNIENKYLDYINTALNIKKRKERINYIYDKTCEILDEHIKQNNICDFKNNKCFVQRMNGNPNFNGCCTHVSCKHLKDGTCLTKNISCKFFYCPVAKKRARVLGMKDIPLLNLFTLRQKFIIKLDVTSSREQILKDLYSYSICWAISKIIVRNRRLMK